MVVLFGASGGVGAKREMKTAFVSDNGRGVGARPAEDVL